MASRSGLVRALGALLVLPARALSWLAARVPDAAMERLGAFLGWLAWRSGIRRQVALSNLRRSFPEKDEASIQDTVRGFYRHLGLLIVEFLRAPALSVADLDRLIEVEGYEAFQAARAGGQGSIVAIAHFGNFELMGSFFSRTGLPVSAITRKLGRNAANAYWLSTRRRAGLREIPDSGSLREIVSVLRRGEVLAVMIDQNLPARRAVFAPFFGQLAATTPAPAVLAERTGVPVWLVLMHRLPGLRHRVTVEGPLPFERSGDRQADVLAFTEKLNRALEERIRAEPDLWWWVHRRWKTRPVESSPGAPSPFEVGTPR